jgi:hypothetical protein
VTHQARVCPGHESRRGTRDRAVPSGPSLVFRDTSNRLHRQAVRSRGCCLSEARVPHGQLPQGPASAHARSSCSVRAADGPATRPNQCQIGSSLFSMSSGVSKFLLLTGHANAPGGAQAHSGWAGARITRAWSAWSAGSWRDVRLWARGAAVVGWGQAREWPGRRAGLRGASRPRWRQSRSPGALPGPGY